MVNIIQTLHRMPSETWEYRPGSFHVFFVPGIAELFVIPAPTINIPKSLERYVHPQ